MGNKIFKILLVMVAFGNGVCYYVDVEYSNGFIVASWYLEIYIQQISDKLEPKYLVSYQKPKWRLSGGLNNSIPCLY